LAYLGSLGSDDEHLNFSVAACARPMIAGDKASHAAVAFDDFRKARRLTDTVFMEFPLARVFLCRYRLRPFACYWSQMYD
jgi:hypothetical protein